MPFLCAGYAAWLRDWTAHSQSPIHQVAHLLALGLLDARFDCLLVPVLVPGPDAAALPSFLATDAWKLPPDFFAERLSSGACVLLVDETGEAAGLVEQLAARWPACRIFTMSSAAALLQSSVTCP